ncbi:hypothetical protein DL93DRAFT_582389 [Clavulina sp. PMI_390]|nr:hypothetical protein DL93DRAFT_582389 [Clavulina sp. PMI_390]
MLTLCSLCASSRGHQQIPSDPLFGPFGRFGLSRGPNGPNSRRIHSFQTRGTRFRHENTLNRLRSGCYPFSVPFLVAFRTWLLHVTPLGSGCRSCSLGHACRRTRLSTSFFLICCLGTPVALLHYSFVRRLSEQVIPATSAASQIFHLSPSSMPSTVLYINVLLLLPGPCLFRACPSATAAPYNSPALWLLPLPTSSSAGTYFCYFSFFFGAAYYLLSLCNIL